MDTDRKPREFTAAQYASFVGDDDKPDISKVVINTTLVCAIVGFILWGILG